MSSPTPLHLPSHLPYPIKIVSHAVHPSSPIERGTRLLTYSYTYFSKETGEETCFNTWESPIEGTVDSWLFKPNDTISARTSAETPAIRIIEPCKHEIQLHGLCCVCGKDMTSYDYTGFSDASRASIQMTHDASGPTVSLEEAQRIERETADHLRKVRKLSLIVDLDQTIVHATVDPTVGEWIAEGEAWEARRSKRNAVAEDAQPEADSEDEVNPNWEALKDVKKFRLGPEALGQQYWSRTAPRAKMKNKSVEVEGCMYYIKPRPGFKQFLESMAVKYEMHVYTMGTRAYAEEVCAAIDPDGSIFGGRVLSRDESGSLTQKSLQRLFPCDQSMVVIIDDRADVWEWSPNLIKVIPYDFFVGIGDINSAFLPKLEPLAPSISTGPGGIAKTSTGPILAPTTMPIPPPVTAAVELVSDEGPSLEEEQELAEMRKSEMLARNAAGLDAQVEQRPLAKMQEELQEKEDEEEAAKSEQGKDEGEKEETAGSEEKEGENIETGKEKAANGGENESESEKKTPEANGANISRSTTPKSERHVRKALLKNDDVELARVQKLLEVVHRRYYEAYDKHPPEDKSMRRKPSKHHPLFHDYDVRRIIPELRLHTLEGTHILFSSVIPLDTRPESTEIWRTAEAFGAKCYTELNSRITHVVAAKRGTVKVDSARRQGGIKIVWLAWFTDSIALWQRQDETSYLIDPEPAATLGPASPPSDPNQISSDPEPDADDWDEDRSAPKANPDAGLELGEVDWDAINNEVEAAMNESDDDDDGRSERSARSGLRSGNASEDEWTDESNSIISSVGSTPRKKRKRLRSLTPSESGINGGDLDALRSPLAKRKKLAAERSGASKLKETISADDLEQAFPLIEEEQAGKRSAPVSPGERDDEEMDEEEEDDDDDDEDEEDEDDFLARELGEEDWG